MGVAQRSAAIRSILLAVALSTVTTAVIGRLVYYSLKRHDRIHAEALERIAVEAQWQRALAAGRVVGALSRHVMQDLSTLQELVHTGVESEGLYDLLVVNADDVVLAAKDRTQIGHRLEDATWRAWKGRNSEVAQRAIDQAGRPVLVVVEPLRNSGDILAWAMLVFAWPELHISAGSMPERLMQTGRMMMPVFVCLLISIVFGMRLAANGIRRQVHALLLSVLEEPALPGTTAPLRKLP